MIQTRTNLILIATALLVTAPGIAQSLPGDYRNEMLEHFDRSSRKLQMLSQAIPAELYTWSPGEGVMSIAQVYMHIARYNYMYLQENLGIPAPSGVDWPNFEAITDKAVIIELLGKSIEHVKQSTNEMSDAELTRETTLYGNQVAVWAVLLQLIAHMNEHVGQSIAYARMNGVVPPWSR